MPERLTWHDAQDITGVGPSVLKYQACCAHLLGVKNGEGVVACYKVQALCYVC